MKKIKLKAWHVKEKRFINLNGVDINFNGCLNEGEVYLVYEQGVLTPFPIEEIELMQFTGLTDKNGTGIYEGDICDNDYMKYEVIFKNGAFRGMALDCEYSDSFNHTELYSIKGLKVIGNIHQNTKLLES